MSQPSNFPIQNVVPYFDDEIDLRQYIVVLFKHWLWIVAVTVLAAVVAFVVSSFLSPTYQADANVIILKSKTEISFEPKFQTTVDDQLNQKGYQDTLVSLVSNSDLTASVMQQAGDILPAEAQNIFVLQKKVEATSSGDVIAIQVKDRSPEVAARLANIWAELYVDYVNTLYGNGQEGLLLEVQNQAADVGEAYRQAQVTWETFLSDNQQASLEREIAVKKDQIQSLRDQAARAEKVPLYLYSLKQNEVRQLLETKYAKLQLVEAWLTDAQTMRIQLAQPAESGSANAGDVLALMFLRSKVLASSSNMPVQLQLNLTDIATDTVSLADVDSLITVIQARKVALEEDIAALSDEVAAFSADIAYEPQSADVAATINQLDIELQELEAEFERQVAQRRELKQARDLTWENYTTIQRKLSEVQLASQITDSQVRLAARAVAPQKPISPRRLMNTAVAGALGLMLSVFGVFAVEYWQNQPPLDDEPAAEKPSTS